MQEAMSPIVATRRLYERVLLATALSGALLVLGVGLSIYIQALRDLNDAAREFVDNLVERHRESLAIEAFLSQNAAYEARLEHIRSESRTRVPSFDICLVGPGLEAGAREVCSDDLVRKAAGPTPNGTIYQRIELEPGRSNSSSVIVSFVDATSPSAVIAASIGQLTVAAFFLVVLFASLRTTLTRYHREVIERTLDLERESASFRAIAQTTQMLAHDVRKPFSKLRAGLAVLERVQTPDAAREAAARLGRETTRSLDAVSGLLADVMEVGSPTAPLVEVVSVTEMIGEVMRDTLTIRDARHVTVRYELCHPRKAAGERRKLLRVLANLVDNAVQATKPGGTIWVATRSGAKDDGRQFVHITIGNTGSYIAPEDRQKLFTTFFTKGKRGGTGLGLAIAKKVVSDHGGEISCASSKEDGTAFTFTIPEAVELDNATDALPTSLLEIEEASLDVEASRAPKGGHLVALVEDDVLMREYWKFSLGDRLAYSCALPRQFWSDLEAGRIPIGDIDIIVTDYHFEPREWGVSGESFAREVRKRLRDKRIVLCSDILPSSLEDATVFDAVIEKLPVSYEQLERAAIGSPAGSNTERHDR